MLWHVARQWLNIKHMVVVCGRPRTSRFFEMVPCGGAARTCKHLCSLKHVRSLKRTCRFKHLCNVKHLRVSIAVSVSNTHAAMRPATDHNHVFNIEPLTCDMPQHACDRWRYKKNQLRSRIHLRKRGLPHTTTTMCLMLSH